MEGFIWGYFLITPVDIPLVTLKENDRAETDSLTENDRAGTDSLTENDRAETDSLTENDRAETDSLTENDRNINSSIFSESSSCHPRRGSVPEKQKQTDARKTEIKPPIGGFILSYSVLLHRIVSHSEQPLRLILSLWSLVDIRFLHEL